MLRAERGEAGRRDASNTAMARISISSRNTGRYSSAMADWAHRFMIYEARKNQASYDGQR